MKQVIMIAALVALGGCGGEPPAPPVEEKAKALSPGEYEIAGEVTVLRSTDKSTPATSAKMGDKATSRACVAADGTLDPKMFVEAGDKCSMQNDYMRGGRMSIQYSCSRKGRGNLYPSVDGNFTADSFEALVVSGSQFSGDGDYSMTRKLSAKRVGDCPASGGAA